MKNSACDRPNNTLQLAFPLFFYRTQRVISAIGYHEYVWHRYGRYESALRMDIERRRKFSLARLPLSCLNALPHFPFPSTYTLCHPVALFQSKFKFSSIISHIGLTQWYFFISIPPPHSLSLCQSTTPVVDNDKGNQRHFSRLLGKLLLLLFVMLTTAVALLSLVLSLSSARFELRVNAEKIHSQ